MVPISKRALAADTPTEMVAWLSSMQAMQLVHGLARQDDARHARSTRRQRQLRLGQPMTVGGNGAQRGFLAARGGVQIDAVEVVARLLGGDGKARLVDQALQVARGDVELVVELARGEVGEILRRQRLQGEARMSRAERQPLLLDVALDLHLGPVGQLAHDVVQDVGGHRHRAGLRHVGRRLLLHLALEVGGLELQAIARCLEQHVRQNGNGRAPLDHARHVTECPHQLTALNHQLHALASTDVYLRDLHGACRAAHRRLFAKPKNPRIGLGDSQAWSRVDRDALLCKGRAGAAPGIFGILQRQRCAETMSRSGAVLDAAPPPNPPRVASERICLWPPSDCLKLQARRHTSPCVDECDRRAASLKQRLRRKHSG